MEYEDQEKAISIIKTAMEYVKMAHDSAISLGINFMKTYTLEQIKRAFWEQFHESGETWFDYLGTEKENESYTQGEWKDFVEKLYNTPLEPTYEGR